MVRISNERSRARRRGPSAEARFQARRREILRAAAAAFRAQGFEAAGMRDIAAAAGLSPANLYYYFQSKDELLFFCQDAALDLLLEACAVAAREEPDPARRLERLVRAHLRVMFEELDGAAAHVATDALPRPLRRRIVDKRDRYERALRAVVVEGVAAGAFAPCDPVLVTRALLGALNWTAHWYRPGGGVSPAGLAHELSRYLLRGLRP